MKAQCQDCGHSVLNHRKMGCIVAVTEQRRVDGGSGLERYERAGHCGCKAYGPKDHPQLPLELES